MLRSLVNLFFPEVCDTCKVLLNDGESIICTTCRHELPVTNFHFDGTDTVKKVVYGRVNLINATALLHFKKQSIVQQLIHHLKYRGNENIGTFLGQWLGAELKTLPAYCTIDVVIPVPLHQQKLRRRGYNQVAKFGEEIAKALDADYNDDTLVKVKSTKTKVFKNRLKRYEDDLVFNLNHAEQLEGKHVLLVDDIITTGATLEACANVLFTIKGLTLSFVTMAITD